MRAVHFEGMNGYLQYDSQTELSYQRTEEKPGYVAALACLLLIWVVFSMAVVVLLIALFDPGHLGLDGLLQEWDCMLPADAPILTT
jgi:hypothetical protein